MHSIRLLMTSLSLVCALAAALPHMARADDDWYSQRFQAATATPQAPAKPGPIARATPAPVTRGWRTVVYAAPAAKSATQSTAMLIAASAHSAVAPLLKPLTGYAHELRGLASYYWEEQSTSSGERFDRHGMTAAHKTLPLGTRVRVTNLANGRSTVVRINDRGPFKPGRVIDLSEAAAQQIDMTGPGIARVAIDVVR